MFHLTVSSVGWAPASFMWWQFRGGPVDMWRATASELKASFSFQSKREARAPFIREAGRSGPGGISLCLTTISTVSFSRDRQFTRESPDKPLSERVWRLHTFWTHLATNDCMTSDMTFYNLWLYMNRDQVTAKVTDSAKILSSVTHSHVVLKIMTFFFFCGTQKVHLCIFEEWTSYSFEIMKVIEDWQENIVKVS